MKIPNFDIFECSFNKEGGNHLTAQFAPIIGHSKEPENGAQLTRVTGMKGISKLFPPNILPFEIDTNHPDRVRALIVDSANPALSGADSIAYSKAYEKLELSVTIDIALTETARLSDYVFKRMIDSDKPIALATFDYSDTWDLMRTKDKKVSLYIEEIASALNALSNEATEQKNEEYPFILMAGERRSYNANQIFRTPD